MDAVDWIDGDPVALRRIRAGYPEAVDPTLPGDVAIAPLAAAGGCPGGLSFAPARAGGTPVVYFHGGGFIVGSPETHRIVTAWISHLTRAPAVSIRYRLAPEHSLPAQAEDAAAAIRRQLARHPRLRLMGDSAGGLVALWGHAALTPADRARIEGAVLFYPAAGPSAPPPIATAEAEAQGLGPRALAGYQRRLDPAGVMAGDPALDPFAPGFPFPRLAVLGAGADPMLPHAEALAWAAGGRLLVAPGQPHSFLAALPGEPALGWLTRAVLP